jgi:hypothetical protein
LTSTGTPIACALALGIHDLINGTAAKPTPTPPMTEVVATRNLRRLLFTSSDDIKISNRKTPHARTITQIREIQNPVNQAGTEEQVACNFRSNHPVPHLN